MIAEIQRPKARRVGPAWYRFPWSGHAGCVVVIRLMALFQILLLTAPVAEVFVPGVVGGRLQGMAAGTVLWGELNCSACHENVQGIGSQMRPKSGPDLASIGLRANPAWLRRYLSAPQTVKGGTSMPDLLHGMGSEERKAAIEDLVHFLAAQREGAGDRLYAPSLSIVDQGRQLFHSVGCVACHSAQESPAQLSEPIRADLGLGPEQTSLAQSVPLGDLAGKTTVQQLSLFLMDPLKIRSAGRMPSMNLTEQEAQAISMYLLRAQIPAAAGRKKQTVSGVGFEYYEADFGPNGTDFSKLSVASTGSSQGFNLKHPHREGSFGFKFSGVIRIQQPGRYTFYTDSDDGSELYISTNLVVNNGGQHALAEQKGTVDLQAGDHSIMVTYFNSGGEAELKVSYEGPGVKKQPIPAKVLFHETSPMLPIGYEILEVDEDRASRGRTLFGSLGCAQCHDAPGVRRRAGFAGALDKLSNLDSGCLSMKPSARAPKYDLAQEQRIALRTALERKALRADLPGSDEQVRLAFSALNCWACHSRNGIGGPAGDRLEYFKILGGADLGDEGRIPPHLTGVGAKLREDWVREVLARKGSVRPYMATRMPQFGDAQVALFISAFSLADAAYGLADPGSGSPMAAKHGRKLVGATGLSCISCHTFDGKKSLGIPAIDLTRMTNRLRFDWFQRYLLDPPSLRPGTRMPGFWPNGVSSKPEILDGRSEAQIAAIWAYLKDYKTVGLPDGLVQGRKELIVEKDPIIYRNFITGAGPRAIAVGYPEKVSLAFDANDVRLALIWQGAFIDAGRHMTGRGEGFEPPLGHNVYALPRGPVLALLANPESVWPDPPERNTGMRFRGYELDSARRPRFFYDQGGWKVEEFCLPVSGSIDPGFVRKLTIRGPTPAGTLWFRAAVGRAITQPTPGVYLVDGRVQIKMTADGTPLIRGSAGTRMELLVPVVFNAELAKIEQEIQW